MATEPESGQVMHDVAKSGANPTSKPVVPQKHTLLRDPMFIVPQKVGTHEVDIQKSEAEEPLQATSAARDLKPVHDMAAEEKIATTSAEQHSDDVSVSSAAKEAADMDKKKAETVAQQEELDKLVQEKKYFVPIGQAQRKRKFSLVIILTVFVLILLFSYLLVDANVIQTDMTLPINFF